MGRLGMVASHEQLNNVIQDQHHRPPFVQPRDVAGKYVMPGWMVVVFASEQQDANKIFATPIYVTGSQKFDRLAIKVINTAVGGSEARLGIYNATVTTNGRINPGSLLLDAGKVATDAIAIVEATIDITLTTGWYYLCCSNDEPFTGRGVADNGANSVPFTAQHSAIDSNMRFVAQAVHIPGDDPLPDPYPDDADLELARMAIVWMRTAN